MILSNDTILREGDLMEHLSLSDEKYSDYYCKVKYHIVVFYIDILPLRGTLVLI